MEQIELYGVLWHSVFRLKIAKYLLVLVYASIFALPSVIWGNLTIMAQTAISIIYANIVDVTVLCFPLVEEL